jgi:hypothetical protein
LVFYSLGRYGEGFGLLSGRKKHRRTNNYLLQHKEVIDFIQSRVPGGKAVFLMFNKETEALCTELGLFPYA